MIGATTFDRFSAMRSSSGSSQPEVIQPASLLVIVLEQLLVLFRAGTASLRSGLGTVFCSAVEPCKAFLLYIYRV